MDVAVAGERCAARTPFLAIATFLLLSNQRYGHKKSQKPPSLTIPAMRICDRLRSHLVCCQRVVHAPTCTFISIRSGLCRETKLDEPADKGDRRAKGKSLSAGGHDGNAENLFHH